MGGCSPAVKGRGPRTRSDQHLVVRVEHLDGVAGRMLADDEDVLGPVADTIREGDAGDELTGHVDRLLEVTLSEDSLEDQCHGSVSIDVEVRDVSRRALVRGLCDGPEEVGTGLPRGSPPSESRGVGAAADGTVPRLRVDDRAPLREDPNERASVALGDRPVDCHVKLLV